MTDLPVIVERFGHTMLVTLNRPRVMNAIDREVATLLGNALHEADHDDEIRALVLTGAGDRAFSSGGDLNVAARGERIVAEGNEHWGFAGYVRHFVDVPTIAAVNGLALGGGFEVVLASDLVVAARRATFELPDVLRGRVAGAGGVVRLPTQLPRKVAMHMLLTGEPISADEAYRLGLVNVVVDDDDVVQAAMDLANRIAQAVPKAVAATKRIAYGMSDGTSLFEDELWQLSSAEIAQIRSSREWNAGYEAFVERRTPSDESAD